MSKPYVITQEHIQQAADRFKQRLSTVKTTDAVTYTETFKDDRKASLVFDFTAYQKMMALVNGFDTEVCWHGVVCRADDSPDTFIIKDVLCPPQYVGGASFDSDDLEYARWYCGLDEFAGNNIRMHGHSHVRMATNPSSTDTKYWSDILSNMHDFYIFLIWNKLDSRTIKIFDIANNRVYDTEDVVLSILGMPDLSDFMKNAKSIVKPISQLPKPVQSAPAKATTTPVKVTTKPVQSSADATIKKSNANTWNKSTVTTRSTYGSACDDLEDPYGPFGYSENYCYPVR